MRTPRVRHKTRPSDARLDAIFSALSDRTRRRMLAQLARSPATVGDLARPTSISLPAVSRHVKVLERAGLVRRDIDGRVHRCRLDAAALRTVDQWLATYRTFWSSTLDALADYVERK